MSRWTPPTDREHLATIRDWFSRHRTDYCRHDSAPPMVWSEYFEWLLRRTEAALDRWEQTS